MRCKAVDGAYVLDDGEPCPHPHHCTYRARCSSHVDPDVLTCPRCLYGVRYNLRRLDMLTPLLPAAAVDAGRVDSEAMNLAGPSDPEGWSWAKAQAIRNGTIDTLDEDDPDHPYAVLGRWDMMLREDYDQPTSLRVTVKRAVAYIDGQLDRMAQDPDQDFALFGREVAACLTKVETVLATMPLVERGAPCPACRDAGEDKAPRLVLERHRTDHSGASDAWKCPACKERWTEAEYRLRVTDDYLDNAESLTAPDMQRRYRIAPGTLRQWVARGHLRQRGRDHSGRILYDVTQAVALRDKGQESCNVSGGLLCPEESA